MSSIEKMALVAVAIIALAGWFLPSTGGNLGGTTNFDEVDVDTLTVGQSTATTSVNLGRMCATVYEFDGTASYWYVSTTGSLATSSVSCN